MRSLMIVMLVLLVGAVPTWACLNEYEPDYEGSPSGTGRVLADRLVLKQLAEERVQRFGPRLKELNWQEKNDYAASLARLGRYDEALKLLLEVDTEHPGEGLVAANIGTVYELKGDLKSAQTWLGQAMKRDPQVSEGTEWLHLDIVKAEQAMQKNPNYLKRHNLIDLDFGKARLPRTPSVWSEHPEERDHMIVALEYQLRERTYFATPPDPIVAELLNTLANAVSLQDSTVDYATSLYGLSLQYGPVNKAEVERRRNHARTLLTELKEGKSRETVERDDALDYGEGIGAALVVLISGAWIMLRHRARRSLGLKG